MSDEQINIAIAEARGWLNCLLPSQDEYYFLTDLELDRAMGKAVGRNFCLHRDGLHYLLPDYCNDLNAIHEAEKMLTEHQWDEYERVLRLVCDGCSYYEGAGKELLHATAAQRAEAYLRTLGKWEEKTK